VRDGAPEEEEDEEVALGWKVIETREGSDDGRDGEEDREHRALPAEMRCFDRAKVFVKAGDGGMGSTAFRREAQVSMGGPSGGNGGDGGSVWIVGDAAKNSLLTFRKTARLRRAACAPAQPCCSAATVYCTQRRRRSAWAAQRPAACRARARCWRTFWLRIAPDAFCGRHRQVHFRAGHGLNGEGKNCYGASPRRRCARSRLRARARSPNRR
jgi:hypothetical protein